MTFGVGVGSIDKDFTLGVSVGGSCALSAVRRMTDVRREQHELRLPLVDVCGKSTGQPADVITWEGLLRGRYVGLRALTPSASDARD